MAHKVSFVQQGEAVVGGNVTFQLRVDPDPALPPMDMTAAGIHFTWDPSALEFMGINTAKEDGELPRILEMMPSSGFYKHFNELAVPKDGTGYYVYMGVLQRDPWYVPAGGGIFEKFTFKVKTATPSVVGIASSATVTWPDGSTFTDATAVYGGIVAGMPRDDVEYVSAQVTPDDTQAPPPTAEQIMADAISQSMSDWATVNNIQVPMNTLFITIIAHIQNYIRSL